MKSVNLDIARVSVIIGFDTAAREIASSFRAYDKILERNTVLIAKAMQRYCDAWMLDNGKSLVSIKAMGKEIRENETTARIVASGIRGLERKTFVEYAQSAMRAVYHGVVWEAGLKNNPEYALPGGKAKSPVPKSGRIECTDRKSVDATASKLLKQLRLIGLHGLAADVLDVLLATLEDFQESPE